MASNHGNVTRALSVARAGHSRRNTLSPLYFAVAAAKTDFEFQIVFQNDFGRMVDFTRRITIAFSALSQWHKFAPSNIFPTGHVRP